MSQIWELQVEHREWLNHNFPNQQPHEPLLGIVEEVGELSHAFLKGAQQIRVGTLKEAEVRQLMADALGDIFIYMMSLCNSLGFGLDGCITQAWEQVKKRDWIKYPHDGMNA